MDAKFSFVGMSVFQSQILEKPLLSFLSVHLLRFSREGGMEQCIFHSPVLNLRPEMILGKAVAHTMCIISLSSSSILYNLNMVSSGRNMQLLCSYNNTNHQILLVVLQTVLFLLTRNDVLGIDVRAFLSSYYFFNPGSTSTTVILYIYFLESDWNSVILSTLLLVRIRICLRFHLHSV